MNYLEPTWINYFSNRIERLVDHFKANLFTDSHPFEKRLVVVSSPLMKNWLERELARDPAFGISMGLEVVFSGELINRMLKKEEGKSYLPSKHELAFAIENEIRVILKNEASEDVWKPLFSMLSETKDSRFSRRMNRRLVRLARLLATLFMEYDLYGGKMLAEWEKKSNPDWQELLWLRLFISSGRYTTLSRHHLSLKVSKHSDQIHLFGINYIPKMELELLNLISQQSRLYLYLLSPCRTYWGDALSEREISRRSEEIEEWEELTQGRNSLLANLGGLGRRLHHDLIDLGISSEDYATSSAVIGHEAYELLLSQDELYENDDAALTLLKAVQADMDFMRVPGLDKKINFSSFDGSIQLHAAPSRRGEVMILHDLVLKMLSEEKMQPSDILVMAPDIALYTPYIKEIFTFGEINLPVEVYDLTLTNHASAIQSFRELLLLAESRWQTSALIALFEIESFQRKAEISPHHVEKWKKWLLEADVRWGEDSSHRNEILQDDVMSEMAVDYEEGTWQHGFEKLVSAIVTNQSDFFSLEGENSELLGKLYYLFRSLREDLKPLKANCELSLNSWSELLKCLYESYFFPGYSGEEELLNIFEELKRDSHSLEETPFSWITIQAYLEEAFSGGRLKAVTTDMQRIRFCSMLPMRAIPAKAVFLLGMEQENFPKKTSESPLNRLNDSPLADKRPTSLDFDRYLFLEASISARERFIMLYAPSTADEEGEPSYVIQELLNYLDEAYTIEDEKISSHCIFKHPYHSFDYRYFQGEKNSLFSYSQERFSDAEAFYSVKKNNPKFIPELYDSSNEKLSISNDSDPRITLKELFAAAKNPLKSYFDHTLGLKIEEKELLKDKEDFTLSPLNRYERKKAAFNFKLEGSDPFKAFTMPPGLFRMAESDHLQKDTLVWDSHKKANGLFLEDVFSVEFNSACQKPVLQGTTWIVPALKMGPYLIEGTLFDVSPKGLLIFKKNSKEMAFELWPKCLILNKAASLLKDLVSIDRKILFLGDGKIEDVSVDNLEDLLKKYLDYTLLCRHNPSLMMPKWALSVLTMDKEELLDSLDDSMNDSFNSFYNEYISWAVARGSLSEADSGFFEKWKEALREAIDLTHPLFKRALK